MALHKVLLCTAFNFEQRAIFAEALEVAQLRLEEGGQALSVGPSATATGASGGPSAYEEAAALEAAAALLESVSKLEAEPGSESLRGMASTALRLCSGNQDARLLPDMLADASLVLYLTARPLLDGAYCLRDKEAGLVLEILRSLHACWQVRLKQ